MKSTDLLKVNVFLNIEGHKTQVGVLLNDNGSIYFKISETYLNFYKPFKNNKFLLSPFKIEHKKETQTCNVQGFDGLFGVFNDSLPDGWGRLLLDRYILSKNLVLNDLNPLNRLLFVGKNGTGALEYEPHYEVDNIKTQEININEFHEASKKILLGENSRILTDFYQLSGTSGGARPKINVGINPKNNHIINNYENLPDNYESWLIKFPSTFDLSDSGNVEFAYYQMALACGIEMSESKLLEGINNNSFFATKRFDRIGNHKLHLHSISGLLHDDFRNTNLDYGHILDAAFFLEKKVSVYEKILKLAVFNVFASNQDDHSKNFSFLLNKNSEWRFSPAYDLTFSQGNFGYQSTSVAKKSKDISTNDFLKLATHFQITNTTKVIEEVKDQLTNWSNFAKNAGVSHNSMQMIKKVIDKKLLL